MTPTEPAIAQVIARFGMDRMQAINHLRARSLVERRQKQLIRERYSR